MFCTDFACKSKIYISVYKLEVIMTYTFALPFLHVVKKMVSSCYTALLSRMATKQSDLGPHGETIKTEE